MNQLMRYNKYYLLWFGDDAKLEFCFINNGIVHSQISAHHRHEQDDSDDKRCNTRSLILWRRLVW